MYHVGRPGEDGYTERILAAWGVDGHNSHTNICSSCGPGRVSTLDGPRSAEPRPRQRQSDPADQRASRIGPLLQSPRPAGDGGEGNGAKLIVFDMRLSNTATHADHWVAPYPGSEAAILLAIAAISSSTGALQPRVRPAVVELEGVPPKRAARCRGRRSRTSKKHSWRSTLRTRSTMPQPNRVSTLRPSKRSQGSWRRQGRDFPPTTGAAPPRATGGWQVARCLFIINALLGAVATEGGIFPNAWNKFVPRPIYTPPHPPMWNELTWPLEFPLAMNEMSFLLPHLLNDGRGRLDVYFTPRLQPGLDQPRRVALDRSADRRIEDRLHVALTPTWNETA